LLRKTSISPIIRDGQIRELCDLFPDVFRVARRERALHSEFAHQCGLDLLLISNNALQVICETPSPSFPLTRPSSAAVMRKM
jgi:hypothetical protein